MLHTYPYYDETELFVTQNGCTIELVFRVRAEYIREVQTL